MILIKNESFSINLHVIPNKQSIFLQIANYNSSLISLVNQRMTEGWHVRMRVENRGGMNQLEPVSSPRHQFPK